MAATDNLKDDPGLASRYLADQLTAEERAAFEARLVEDPQLLAELEATARLKVGLANLERSGQLQRLIRPRSFFNHPGVLAMAASVAVLAIGLVLWRGTLPAEESFLARSATSLVSSAGEGLTLGGSYALLRTRGNTYDATVDLPAVPQALEFRVLPDVDAEPARYLIAFTRLTDGGAPGATAEISGLEPGDDGFVTFYVDSSKLAPGRYEVAIQGDAGTSSEHGRETFIVRVAPAQ